MDACLNVFLLFIFFIFCDIELGSEEVLGQMNADLKSARLSYIFSPFSISFSSMYHHKSVYSNKTLSTCANTSCMLSDTGVNN